MTKQKISLPFLLCYHACYLCTFSHTCYLPSESSTINQSPYSSLLLLPPSLLHNCSLTDRRCATLTRGGGGGGGGGGVFSRRRRDTPPSSTNAAPKTTTTALTRACIILLWSAVAAVVPSADAVDTATFTAGASDLSVKGDAARRVGPDGATGYYYRRRLATTSGSEFVFCDGIPGGGACCSAACGECGGSGCSDRGSGAEDCCTGGILDSGVMCSDTGGAPPCILDGRRGMGVSRCLRQRTVSLLVTSPLSFRFPPPSRPAFFVSFCGVAISCMYVARWKKSVSAPGSITFITYCCFRIVG